MRKIFILGLLCLLVGPGCRTKSTELQVFSAASLGKAVEEASQSEQIPIKLHLGGSHALVRQADLGARADLLLLADDRLAQETLEPKGYHLLALASNRMVVIAPRSADGAQASDFQAALLSARGARLAVGDPKTAPLGGYTAEALKGIKHSLVLVPMSDAKAVLTAVSLGHAERGIVYRTDAMEDASVVVVAEIPAERHKAILYVAVTPPEPSAEAISLVESLRSGRGQQILAEQGFLPPPVAAQTQAAP